MRHIIEVLTVYVITFSNSIFSQSYWSWGNIPDLDTLGKYEYHLNKVKKVYLVTAEKYQSQNTINSYRNISNIDTLGNVLTEITTKPDSDSILYSKKFIYDENFSLIKIFRDNFIYVQFDYDDSNRVNKHTTFKNDGSIFGEIYFDYINKYNDKLRELLLCKYDGRIDTIFTHDYAYIFYNYNPIRLLLYYKNYLATTYVYDAKGRISNKTEFRESGDTLEYERIFYDDENKTQLSEIYNSIVMDKSKKYKYVFDNSGNLIRTYQQNSDDSIKILLMQEFDKNNNLIVSRNYDEEFDSYFWFYKYNEKNKVVNFMSIQNGKILFQRHSDYYPNGLIKSEIEYEGSRIIKEKHYTYEYY